MLLNQSFINIHYIYRTWYVNTLLVRKCCNSTHLTHLPLNKLAPIFADDIFNCILLSKNDGIPLQISQKRLQRSN